MKAGDTNEYAFSTVEFSNWTNLGIMPGVTVTVARVSASQAARNFITLYGGALKLNGANGDFSLSNAKLRTYDSESFISVGDNGAGTLNLASGATMNLNAPTSINGLLVATGTLRLGADATVRDFQLPKKSTVYLDGHVLTVTNPAKRKSLSVLGTVDAGDGKSVEMIGTFIKAARNDVSEYYLDIADNLLHSIGLYCSEQSVPSLDIPAYRCYFRLNGFSNPSLVSARVVRFMDVTTDIDSPTVPTATKLLRDGQLLIFRDGVQYTITGLKVE